MGTFNGVELAELVKTRLQRLAFQRRSGLTIEIRKLQAESTARGDVPSPATIGVQLEKVNEAATSLIADLLALLREDSANLSLPDFERFWSEVSDVLTEELRSYFLAESALVRAYALPTGLPGLRQLADYSALVDYYVQSSIRAVKNGAAEALLERKIRRRDLESADAQFMRLALEQAKKCVAEERADPPPKVGAVLVKDGRVLGEAFRGELGSGEHAEFSLLGKKLKDAALAGATLYVTLEPCTARNPPKSPCAQHIIDRKIARVVIGALDPNREILGTGVFALREAGIEIELARKAEWDAAVEMNREFIDLHRHVATKGRVAPRQRKKLPRKRRKAVSRA